MAYVVNGEGFLVDRLGAAIRTADGCDEVDSKPAHAKPACAAANFVPADCVSATRGKKNGVEHMLPSLLRGEGLEVSERWGRRGSRKLKV